MAADVIWRPAVSLVARRAAFVLCAGACAIALGLLPLPAQLPNPVREIELHPLPADARVRPFESIAVQVRAFASEQGQPSRFRRQALNRGLASFHLRDGRAGWLSKPFRFQGLRRNLPRDEASEGYKLRLASMAQRLGLPQDTVLFTASGREGEAILSATLEGATASLRIVVDSGAPLRAAAERVSFGPQPRSREPYRPLAEHYAPYVAQETWFQPRSDYIVRFDADGDWRGDNNWSNAPRASTQAYVYYAVIATDTHWFLIYNFFHMRDYSDECVSGTCHENDNEGMILTVARDGSATGKPVAMETLAHNKLYSYRADPRVRGNLHGLDGEVEFVGGSHPVVFVHSGGHGVYGSGRHSGYVLAEDRFVGGTGVTYVYKGVAERPLHPADRDVGYDLLPIYEHWWLPSQGTAAVRGRTFSSYFRYEPRGDRPPARFDRIAGAFRGIENGADMAKPFWAWHDKETRKRGALAKGQWALDPAYAVTRNLSLPQPVSLDYTFNPYLRATAGPGASVGSGADARGMEHLRPK